MIENPYAYRKSLVSRIVPDCGKRGYGGCARIIFFVLLALVFFAIVHVHNQAITGAQDTFLRHRDVFESGLVDTSHSLAADTPIEIKSDVFPIKTPDVTAMEEKFFEPNVPKTILTTEQYILTTSEQPVIAYREENSRSAELSEVTQPSQISTDIENEKQFVVEPEKREELERPVWEQPKEFEAQTENRKVIPISVSTVPAVPVTLGSRTIAWFKSEPQFLEKTWTNDIACWKSAYKVDDGEEGGVILMKSLSQISIPAIPYSFVDARFCHPDAIATAVRLVPQSVSGHHAITFPHRYASLLQFHEEVTLFFVLMVKSSPPSNAPVRQCFFGHKSFGKFCVTSGRLSFVASTGEEFSPPAPNGDLSESMNRFSMVAFRVDGPRVSIAVGSNPFQPASRTAATLLLAAAEPALAFGEDEDVVEDVGLVAEVSLVHLVISIPPNSLPASSIAVSA